MRARATPSEMKLGRRALLIDAAVSAEAMSLHAGQGRRPACAGGSCCPRMPGLNLPAATPWPTVEATNAKPEVTASESITNRQR